MSAIIGIQHVNLTVGCKEDGEAPLLKADKFYGEILGLCAYSPPSVVCREPTNELTRPYPLDSERSCPEGHGDVAAVVLVRWQRPAGAALVRSLS
jgi:hypothetical protein